MTKMTAIHFPLNSPEHVNIANVERLIETIDRYQRLPESRLHFGMESFNSPGHCGTTMCIAGWSKSLYIGDLSDDYDEVVTDWTAQDYRGVTDAVAIGERFLGLSSCDAYELFYWLFPDLTWDRGLEDVTWPMAREALTSILKQARDAQQQQETV